MYYDNIQVLHLQNTHISYKSKSSITLANSQELIKATFVNKMLRHFPLNSKNLHSD